MPVYTVTANTAVVAPDETTARALAANSRWIIQAVRELPDEADGHAIVTGPEALDAHNQACAWADDPSGDTIAGQAAYHRWVEADRLAGDTPRSATWVGDAA